MSTIESNVGIGLLGITLLILTGIGGSCAAKLDNENKNLKIALQKTEERQNRLNDTFRELALETERQLTIHEQEIQNINSRVKTFQATKDPESGAIVWDESPISE